MSKTKKLIRHSSIKRWAEERGGRPCIVKGTDALLRINFPGGAEDSLENITWDEWFEIFEDHGLAFLCQNTLANGEMSRFFKLVNG